MEQVATRTFLLSIDRGSLRHSVSFLPRFSPIFGSAGPLIATGLPLDNLDLGGMVRVIWKILLTLHINFADLALYVYICRRATLDTEMVDRKKLGSRSLRFVKYLCESAMDWEVRTFKL